MLLFMVPAEWMCSRHSCYFKIIVFLLLVMLGGISMYTFIWAIAASYFRWFLISAFSYVFCVIRQYEFCIGLCWRAIICQDLNGNNKSYLDMNA
jgi:hypothetical protein